MNLLFTIIILGVVIPAPISNSCAYCHRVWQVENIYVYLILAWIHEPSYCRPGDEIEATIILSMDTYVHVDTVLPIEKLTNRTAGTLLIQLRYSCSNGRYCMYTQHE